MLIAIPYLAILAAFDCISSMLTLTFFLKVKGVVDYLQQLFQHVGCYGRLVPLMAAAITAKSV